MAIRPALNTRCKTTVRSGLPSFIVSLAFLFFLRGLTEVCFRYLNKGPNDKTGSTQVSDLPDFKNLIDLERYREVLTWPLTEAANAAQGCLSVFARPLQNSLAKLENVQTFVANASPSARISPEQLAAIQERAAAATSKEEIATIVDEVCAVDPNSISLVMERAFAQTRLPAEDLV